MFYAQQPEVTKAFILSSEAAAALRAAKRRARRRNMAASARMAEKQHARITPLSSISTAVNTGNNEGVSNPVIDVGSTTIKLVILNENKEVVYKRYERHFSNIKKTIHMFLSDVVKEYNDVPIKLTVTGSGGLSSSKWLEVPFIQEVIACVKAVEETIEGTDVVIELGGEDAKITFFTNGIEQRMNGTCAGGTMRINNLKLKVMR